MENKKSSFQNNPNLAGNEPPFESIPKHQHNTAPQHLRLVQYGLKIPNHHHIIGNKSPLVSPNQHIHQPYQPQVHRNQPQYNMPNIHANPLHLHYNGQFPGNNNKQHQQQITQHQQQLQLQQNYQSNKQALASPAAQIWVPQKPPPHYHQKLRTEAPVSPSSSTTATTTTVATTPTHAKQLREIVDLKKKPTNQHLRSPSAKRSADAPVTMQGWLHKQGSDGLMLWKKRWFVLTEYCLFYYKGPEEEKLLGSILLPSYKVSLCSSDDKVNKKFAFKCEHANMRTYILAADTQELLLQWVRALNLACTLQTNIESESSIMNTSSSLHDQSMDNSDSGYNNHIRNTPVHLHTSSNATDLSNPSQEVSQYTQPLYANAPPKPRRLNDAGYSSPSPDDIDKYNEPKYVTLQPPPYQHNRYLVKSPMAIYNNLEYPSPIATNNNERRTPDTYGRSNIRPSNGRTISDYEDVYAEQYIYKRPLSPLAYNKTNALMMPMQRMHSAMPPDSQYTRRQSPVTIPRPHSADFLEYEVSHRKNNNSTPVNRQPRPKSSLDINRNCNSDNYFYSEERYAEKMRKSAQYLSKMPSKYLMQNRMEQQDNTFPITRSNTQPLGHNYMSSTEYARKDLPQLRSHNFLNEASLQKESNDSHYSSKYRDLVSPSQDLSFYNYNDKEYDPFTRSASARLASIEQRLQGDGRASMNKEGERKREESMKRLLEWKQRMLQSNLNRKMNQSSNKVYFKSDAGYGRSVDGNGRTTRLPSAQYNSYSSDDEENADGRKSKESMQAGRTLETMSSDTAPYASIPVLASQTDTPKHITLSTQFVEDTLTKPLQLYSKEASNIAHVSSLRSEFSEKFEQSPIVTEIKSNGALVKSILAEFEKQPDDSSGMKASTPVPISKEVEAIIEENYLPMTPKKAAPMVAELKMEENPYVEMTQGNTSSLLENVSTPHQPYEMISFKEGIAEPVYMELHQPKKAVTHEDEPKNVLPDILRLSQTTSKSESSDADDEASKDLDSLYIPNHPRFSFSDSFRPASYYLGVSQSVPEQPDSSDSELVSPPSIPRSPPPIEDLESDKRKLAPKTSLLSLTISYKDQDSNSICSIQTDPEMSSFLRMNNSDSDVDLRNSILNTQSYERMLKRRPLSKDYGNELESNDINKTGMRSSELDAYIKKLEVTESNFQIKNYPDYENMFVESCGNIEESKPSQSSFPMEYLFEKTSQDEALKEYLRDNSGQLFFANSVLCFNQNQSTGAPYYYSDLNIHSSSDGNAIFTLNNQRGNQNNGEKRDISHIVNPIRNNNISIRQDPLNQHQRKVNKLASDARSASVDFLNIADKFGQIDKKNVYESDTLKRLKVLEPSNPEINTQLKNIYPSNTNEKFNRSSNVAPNDAGIRRSHSLEGLLENALNANENQEEHNVSEGSHIWEEDSIWRERLRNASQRHTKSLDDLDCIGETKKKMPRGITRGAIYVNDHMCNMPVQDKYVKTEENGTDEARSPGKSQGGAKGTADNAFIIDREKLRQWDLMSSAPSDSPSVSLRANTEVDISSGLRNRPADPESQEPASGSISLNLRDTYPRNASHNKWPSQQSLHSKSTSNLKRALDNDYLIKAEADYYMPRAPSHHDIAADNKRKQVLWKEKLNVSAGDLLGRTHEELVLLLIQLRRQSTNTAHAIEAYYNEIDSIQAQLHLMDAAKRLENLQKLEQIRQHLLDLEKQYEKGKPLVNLVDNMVKLGSLYSFPNEKHNYAATHLKDRLEFNQQMQEKRMLAEENRDWNRVKPNHSQLQEKVQQLYQLDRLIQEESDTLQGLQQDKEEIERALGGLRHKLMHGYNDPAIVEQARKQQSILENELSRVHLMLAQNSKKLEETVASNARLEQELLVLKQKLQVSRQNRFSPQISNAGDSLNCVVGTSAMMESDLQKVQQSVSDLQRQRQELSMQVRQLTDRSSLPQTKTFSPATMPLITIQQPQETKKKSSSQWRETDLDSTNKSEQIEGGECKLPTTPLYIQTDLKQGIDTNESYSRSVTSDSASEDTANGHSMFQPEKQEIKTVRIVKRESERRQRDRERNVPGKWDPLTEEDDYFPSNQNSSLYKTTPVVQKAQSSTNVNFAESEESLNRTVSSPSISNYEDDKVNKSPELSPVFKSEAARQIITEMSNQDAVSAKQQQLNRRLVPKEKRRHYTAPNNNLIMKSLNQLSTEDEDTFSKALRNTRRARDDMDMERALRQRMDAPDVVRSTLGSKELKYNESTIDNLLGTPNKISIPERYVPEQLPQLSAEEQEHRLRKVESIKKMLSDTAILSSSSANLAATEDTSSGEVSSSNNATGKVNSKIIEEKKQREHILQLNQILAKQVMEMSKIVAVNALSRLPLNDHHQSYSDDEDLSPETPLPLYQQRDNFYS